MNDQRSPTTSRIDPNHSEWLTLRRAAMRAAVSEATIKREVRRGCIRAARVGGRRCLRFRPEWIDAWLDASAAQPKHESRSA
jgi:excisionase family DNA binding protein